ncbi:hypothetical protein F4802DRAFT_603322 [Xylaria palmicola]|nr:hypothetical protein F4802DRAFT_603322 [Xylaria palmicola]
MYDIRTACSKCHEPSLSARILRYLFGAPAPRCRHHRRHRWTEQRLEITGVARRKGCKNPKHTGLTFLLRPGADSSSSSASRRPSRLPDQRTAYPPVAEAEQPQRRRRRRYYACPCPYPAHHGADGRAGSDDLHIPRDLPVAQYQTGYPPLVDETVVVEGDEWRGGRYYRPHRGYGHEHGHGYGYPRRRGGSGGAHYTGYGTARDERGGYAMRNREEGRENRRWRRGYGVHGNGVYDPWDRGWGNHRWGNGRGHGWEDYWSSNATV